MTTDTTTIESTEAELERLEHEKAEQERQARAALEQAIAAEQDAELARVKAACDAERAATGGVVDYSPEDKLPT